MKWRPTSKCRARPRNSCRRRGAADFNVGFFRSVACCTQLQRLLRDPEVQGPTNEREAKTQWLRAISALMTVADLAELSEGRSS